MLSFSLFFLVGGTLQESDDVSAWKSHVYPTSSKVLAYFCDHSAGNEKTMVVRAVTLPLMMVSCSFVIPTLLRRVVDVGVDLVKRLQYSIG